MSAPKPQVNQRPSIRPLHAQARVGLATATPEARSIPTSLLVAITYADGAAEETGAQNMIAVGGLSE